MSEYKPKRGDFVEVVNRPDEWNGLRGIVEGVDAPPAGRVTFYEITFPEREGSAGPTRRPQFVASQLRPLVVLDLAYPKLTATVLRQVAEYIREKHGIEVEDSTIADEIADQIEAQTKPPRIPEPGWGEKVVAHTSDNPTRRQFVRFTASRRPFSTNHWYGADDTRSNQWGQLIDPEPVK